MLNPLSALMLVLFLPVVPATAGDTIVSRPPARPTFSFRTAAPPPSSALTRGIGLKPIRHQAAKKATAAVAGGVLGFFGGMLAGAGIGGLVNGEDGALVGFMIGAPVGAAVGGVMGALWAR